MKNATSSRVKQSIKLCSIVFLFLISFGTIHSSGQASQSNNTREALQTRKIPGVVIDFETGEAIIGASISIVGKGVNAISDVKGNFIVELSRGDNQIEVSYFGYKKQVLTVGDSKEIEIKLHVDLQQLNAVVVVGYGTSARKDLTGSISKVNVQDMRKAPVSNFEESLAGRVAGVQVTSGDGQPGSDLQIVIRGNNSVTQNNMPLYVIDGFPVEDNVGNILNPEEIESIEILKDASATAIYGARGANGVVIVTSKKGGNNPPVVTYSGWAGVHQVIKKQDVLGPYEFVRYQLEQNYALYSDIYLHDGKVLEDYKKEKGINWQDLIYRDAFVHSHSVAVRGGTEKTRYSISGSLMEQDGVVLNSGYKKYQGRVVLDQTITNKLKVGINLNYTATKKYGTISSDQEVSPTANLMYSVWGYRPVSGKYSEEMVGELFDPDVDSSRDYRINPYMSVTNEYNPVHTNHFFANAYLNYRILDNLILRIAGGYKRTNQKREVFFSSNSRGGHKYSNNKVNALLNNVELTDLLNENTLTYFPKIKGGHNLTLLAGLTLQEINRHSSEIVSINIPNESLGMAGMDEGQVTRFPITDRTSALLSYLGRVTYNYKSKYLFTASFRADGSSKFPRNNRWAYFPSASIAWGFGEETFVKDLNIFSSGKIRAGYGATGNNRVSDYASLTSLEITPSSGYGVSNAPEQGVVPTNLGNTQLKWETTEQTNIGLDLGFLDNRIIVTADYYYKKTRDLLLNATLAPSMGYLNAYRNVGMVTNSGFEFTLETVNIETKDFQWSSSFNISFNKNKVLALNEDEPSLATRVTWGNFNNAYPYIAIPGQPIAMFYGYHFNGVYQYEDFEEYNGKYTLRPGIPNNGNPREKIQPGDIKFRDINGDGQVNDNDLTIIGNPNPLHFGGFNNNFQYKNFDLNIFLQWSYGAEILNANRIEFEGGDPVTRNFLNMFASYADRWTPENQTNKLYRDGGQGPAVYSSRTIEDGSYLRLKTVSLGYRIPHNLLRKIGIKSLRVSVSAQNLFTLTNYSGLDPEVSTRPTALTPSFDWSPYPRQRSVIFGVDITF